MASPATARRSEPSLNKLQPERDDTTSPQHFTEAPTSPPAALRPSISPLSSASKPAKSSPPSNRTTDMQNNADADLSASLSQAADGSVAEASDIPDDGSSSLSEPDEDPYDDLPPSSIDGEISRIDKSAAQPSLEVDSEAETDRLDQTPQKKRKHSDSLGRTPSKLSRITGAEEDLSEPPSPVFTGAGAASSTSTIATNSKKRKRADAPDSPLTSAESELSESPRKTTQHSAGDDETAEPNAEGMIDDETADADEDVADVEENEAADEEPGTGEIQPAKGVRGRKEKVKGKAKKALAKEPDTEQEEDSTRADEEQPEEKVELSAEDLKQQKAASSMFDVLTKQFTAFREKLCDERLAKTTAELEMLNQTSCQHPEYLRQVACVDARHAKQVSETQAFYRYKLQTLRRSTLAERSQLHSQYFQYVRDLREEVMHQLGEDWFNIQKERRQSHQETERAYAIKFPAKKSVQIRHQAKYNQEVSVLSGLAKYVGFPAAPELAGPDGDMLDDDLKAMRLPKRAATTTTNNQLIDLPLAKGPLAAAQSQYQNERLAHEQFIEQNAWARPQAPVHTHGTPNLTHTPDWAEPTAYTSAKHLMRNLSGPIPRAGSPYTTPFSQRQAPIEQSSAGTVAAMNSDPTDVPSSLHAAPPASDRSQQLHDPDFRAHTFNTSPLSMPKTRQLTGFRNISGASTIDAPPDSAEKDKALGRHSFMPVLMDSTPSHRATAADDDRPSEAFPNSSMRPRDGAFGTPAPLPVTSAP